MSDLPGLPRRTIRRLRSIRGQAATAAALVVGLGLALGGLVVVLVLQGMVVSSLEDTLRGRLAEDTRLLTQGGLAQMVSTESSRGRSAPIVVVIDAQGATVYASEPGNDPSDLAVVRLVDQVSVRALDGGIQVQGRSVVPLPGSLRKPLVVARSVDVGTQSYVLAVAAPQDDQQDGVTTAALLLALVAPFLVALAAWTVWWRVGRALGSVDDLRRRVDRIGASQLHARVPVPSTGDEVADLATTMNSMLERLQRSQKAQRQFVADASHELRSPIATLLGIVELLGPGDEAGWHELRPLVGSEAQRLSCLVDDLLLLSRADDDALAVVRDEVDLDDLVGGEVRRLRGLGRHRVVARLGPARVAGDAGHLTQVCRNLLDNAARYADSTIVVTLSALEGRAVLVVDDDGPGIAPGDRERAFDRFVRLDPSRDRGSGGAGLGLAIVREIVRAHGGRVSVETSPRGGARFVVDLPLLVSESSPPALRDS
ncbi:MAG: HAMP domain-containing histidine kinase [Actinomycetota bacterium]|nr:HAMP domain-containing histidine kinase [Actinomycetota bacterium]